MIHTHTHTQTARSSDKWHTMGWERCWNVFKFSWSRSEQTPNHLLLYILCEQTTAKNITQNEIYSLNEH